MTEHEHAEQPESMHPQRLETVVVQRPRCPRCRGAELRKYRSITDQGDGSSLSWMRCQECGERFRLLRE
jgi:DNA-directed RNA polymerase subunit M/transcription elongation factor TFIIS